MNLTVIKAQEKPSQTNPENEFLQKIDLAQFPTPIYQQYIGNGVTLDWLINQSLTNNRNLLAARQTRDILAAKRLQAGLRPNPQISVQFGSDQLASRTGEYDLDATFSQPFERGGKRQKRVQVVELELAQAEKEIAFQEQTLRSEIYTQYINTLATAKTLELLEKLVALTQENLRLVTVKFEQGEAAKLDLQLTQVELNRWKSVLLQTDLQVKASILQLKTLAGLEADTAVKLTEFFPTQITSQLDLLDLQTQALASRLDLQAARLKEELSQAQIDLATANAKADINLFATYSEEREVEDMVVARSSNINRKIGVGITIPLTINNRNQGTIAQFTATKTQIRYQREQLEQQIKQEVALALNRLESSKETLKLFEIDILPKAQDNLKIISIAYQLGEQELLAVIAEQRRLIDFQQQFIQINKEYYLSLVALEKAIGGKIN
ncbi:MAG: TolC family protein [Blastocatellia bacterium]|nr:TolC family protein [Blastocatellia bacterium]